MAPRQLSPAPLDFVHRGVALPVALVMLAVILVLGLAAVRMTASEERMAAYSQDRAIAFQAAEAALSEAEERVELIKPMPAQCADFVAAQISLRACPPAQGIDSPRWQNVQSADWFQMAVAGVGGAVVGSRVLIEYLGGDFACDVTQPATQLTCRRYRITANAGGNGRADVTLQSIYATD